MKFTDLLLKHTFYQTISKKDKKSIRYLGLAFLALGYLGITLTLIVLPEQPKWVILSLLLFVFIVYVMIKIQNRQRKRIINNNKEICGMVKYDGIFLVIDSEKFQALMKKKIRQKLQNKRHLINEELLDFCLNELQETNKTTIGNVIQFGVILAFLFNPFLSSYITDNSKIIFSQGYLSTFYLISILIFTLILFKSDKVLLGLNQSYISRKDLIKILIEIKIDTLKEKFEINVQETHLL